MIDTWMVVSKATGKTLFEFDRYTLEVLLLAAMGLVIIMLAISYSLKHERNRW